MSSPDRASAIGKLALVAIVLSLAGCGGPKYPSVSPLASQSGGRIAPADDRSALRLARATREAGELTSAVQLYRNLVTTRPAEPEVLVEYGDVLLDAGGPDDAIDVYSQIGAGSSARLGALLGLTRAYLTLGEPAKALDYADQAKTVGPKDPRVFIDRGVALDSLLRHAEAQECYRAVLRTAPRHVAARNNLALSLALTGRYSEAIALIAPLVRSSAATPKQRENMALIYGLMGDANRATALSRVDLDARATRENLAFLASVRGASR